MSRHDEDGDLAGMTPNDDLGDVHARSTHWATNPKVVADARRLATFRIRSRAMARANSVASDDALRSLRQWTAFLARTND